VLYLLKRISGPNREEVLGGWKRLHNEELHNLYASSIRVIKSRKIMWPVHVARMGEMRYTYNILVGKPERRSHSEDLGVDGKKILEFI
jgi:hypothetical protein